MYRLGSTTVSCEGYDHPDDPYVLAGSCAVEYTMHYAPGHNRQTAAAALAPQQQQQQQYSNYGSDYSTYDSNTNYYGSTGSSGNWIIGLVGA